MKMTSFRNIAGMAYALLLTFMLVGCTKADKGDKSYRDDSSYFIPTQTSVLDDLKKYTFGSGAASLEEAKKILEFLGSDVEIHYPSNAPGYVCGKYKSGWHLIMTPDPYGYYCNYGNDDEHEFVDSPNAANFFAIMPGNNTGTNMGSGAGGSGSGGSGGGTGGGTGGGGSTGTTYAIFYYGSAANGREIQVTLNGSLIMLSPGNAKVLYTNWGTSAPSCSTTETQSGWDPSLLNVIKVPITQTNNSWTAKEATTTKSWSGSFTKSGSCNIVQIK